MYIIGGQCRRRKLSSPKGGNVRPTTGRLREALFDICQPFIEDATVLDLFAGTGAVGLEALSRGARSATFVEMDRSVVRCLQKNIKDLDFENAATVLCGDAFKVVPQLGQSFDIIYVDPPYEKELSDVL